MSTCLNSGTRHSCWMQCVDSAAVAGGVQRVCLQIHPMCFDSEPAPCECRKLKALQSLEVCGGGVTDSGVACLQDLSQLRSLSLAQVTRQTSKKVYRSFNGDAADHLPSSGCGS